MEPQSNSKSFFTVRKNVNLIKYIFHYLSVFDMLTVIRLNRFLRQEILSIFNVTYLTNANRILEKEDIYSFFAYQCYWEDASQSEGASKNTVYVEYMAKQINKMYLEKSEKKKLELSYTPIQPKEAMALFHTLKFNSSVEELSLDRCSMGENSIMHAIYIGRNNPKKWKRITLSNNKFASELCVKSLKWILLNAPCLTFLNLSNIECNTIGAKIIAENLESLPELQNFYFNNNAIFNEGAGYIIKSLMNLKNICLVSLKNTHLSDEISTDLSNLLQSSQIAKIFLASNIFGANFFNGISTALSHNNFLEQLDFELCAINDSAAVILLKSAITSKLKFINLSSNGLTSVISDSIKILFSENENLTTITVFSDNTTLDEMRELKNYLKKHYPLKEFIC